MQAFYTLTYTTPGTDGALRTTIHFASYYRALYIQEELKAQGIIANMSSDMINMSGQSEFNIIGMTPTEIKRRFNLQAKLGDNDTFLDFLEFLEREYNNEELYADLDDYITEYLNEETENEENL